MHLVPGPGVGVHRRSVVRSQEMAVRFESDAAARERGDERRLVEVVEDLGEDDEIAVRRARSRPLEPEHHRLVPLRRHPPGVRAASSPSGSAAHTPRSSSSAIWSRRPSSVRMARASTWPSTRRASDRSSRPMRANALQRCSVWLRPGNGRAFSSSSRERASSTAVRANGGLVYASLLSDRHGRLRHGCPHDGTVVPRRRRRPTTGGDRDPAVHRSAYGWRSRCRCQPIQN